MKAYLYKNKWMLLLAFLLISAGIGLFLFFSTPLSSVTETKTVESVRIEDNGAFFTFADDAVTYAVYYSNGVEPEALDGISAGDTFTVTRNAKGGTQYTILFKLETESTVLFDVTSYYVRNHYLVLTVFSTVPFIMGIVLLAFTSTRTRIDFDPTRFKIRLPRYGLIYCAVMASGGLAFFLEFLYFYLHRLIPLDVFYYGFLGLLLFALPFIGIILWLRTSFSLEDGVFCKSTPLGKTRIRISELSLVKRAVRKKKFLVLVKIEFYGKNGEMLCSVTNDPNFFDHPLFRLALEVNGIALTDDLPLHFQAF
ncbi:MAG: hypothetical protein IKP55_02695 [Clostridia bacterium]|nr:hypothetical protein [Clostridia bacterium]